MSNGPIATYSFLSWSRQGVAALLTNPDPIDGSASANVTLPVRLHVNAAHEVDVDLRLYGPGDVIGLDAHEVIRTEPRDQTKDFIPNYLPAVEFSRPDLPWLFTPATRNSRDRLRPWLVLVVVERQDGVTLTFGRRQSLPVLRIAGPAVPINELPPLEDSWAWGHVQVSGDLAPGRTLGQAFTNEPHNVSSRLLCPRKLVPNRDYLACLVPAFEAGRLVGLDLPPVDTLAPSWSTDPAPESIDLPVYYHWEFSTGASGDFESLARLLEPRVVPETVGMRTMDISDPGFGMPQIPSEGLGRVLGLEGALRAPTGKRTDWPQPAQSTFQAALTDILNAPNTSTPVEEPGPLVAPPLYGRWHAAETSVPEDQPRWFKQLNLDPRERTAAGFGTLVVQDQQESLMHSAWEQIDDVLAANRLLMRAQLARSVGVAILDKDLRPMTTSTLVQITRPMHTRVRMSPVTLHKLVEDSRVPSAAASNTLRRIARPRGPLAHRIYAEDERHVRPILQRLDDEEIAAAPPRSLPDGTITPSEPADATVPDWLPKWLRNLLPIAVPVLLVVGLVALLVAIVLAVLGLWGLAVVLGLIAVASTAAGIVARGLNDRVATADTLETVRFTPEEIESVPARPTFQLLGETDLPVDPTAAERRAPGPDSEAAALFRQAASAFQTEITRSDDLAEPVERPSLSLSMIQQTLLTRINPQTTVPARVLQRIDITPGIWSPPDPIEPIMAHPRFERPMYEGLAEISPELLLPGLDQIKPNTVTLLETNSRFIEAYMVGLNHEMGRELLWREYPTDQRGSYFRQFWDVRGRVPAPRTPQEHEQLKDIPPIHGWTDANDLGANMTGGSVEGKLVLLVRGELLRRFPTAMVYAARAQFKPDVTGALTRARTPTTEEKYPLFRGTLEPDVTFVGFDLDEAEARGNPEPENGDPGWFLIIQQQPTEPRFGLDVVGDFADTLPPLTSWDNLSWGYLAADQEAFDAMTHIRLGAELPNTGGVQDPPGIAWAENAAQQAFITLQKPVRIAIHADDMLPA